MKRVNTYRKLLNATADTDLVQLKTTYRNLIKEWHPDKIQDDDERKAEAEIKSKEIIAGYHFLVSIAPETIAQNLEEYKRVTTTAYVEDFEHKGQNLKITFQGGSVYEYLGVPKSIYIKMVNSPTITRFAKRHIFNSYIYRNIGKETEVEA
ncbi:MAG TPA: KTSC domain-containing protein [Chitinophagaceae bacterium]|nr:KTSC domain-containing protein [Chitinophagaceae bacterium]